jgi:hypothetical protein
MDGPIRVLGRRFEPQDLVELQGWIDQQRASSRRQLSVGLAQLWDWRNARGQLRDLATRLLLNRLERQGLLRLPARQKRGGRRWVCRPMPEVLPSAELITEPLSQLEPLSVRLLRPADSDRRRLAQYFAGHHYLGYLHPLGQLHYLVQDRKGRDLAGLLFGPAAWNCRVRDRFIGWTATQRQAHLGRLVNNSRFLILPWVVVPSLASRILGLVRGRLPADWQAYTGQMGVLVESFVEVDRFAGTCYRADNWIDLGLTQGRSRNGRPGLRVPVKRLLVRPLSRRFRQELGG